MEKVDSWVSKNCKFAQQVQQRPAPQVQRPVVPPMTTRPTPQPQQQAQTQETALFTQAVQWLGKAKESLAAAMNAGTQYPLHRKLMGDLLNSVTQIEGQARHQLGTIFTQGPALPPVDLNADLGLK